MAASRAPARALRVRVSTCPCHVCRCQSVLSSAVPWPCRALWAPWPVPVDAPVVSAACCESESA
eukprot:scaffold21164_cov101-Isochrysis_galbana.AAC.4